MNIEPAIILVAEDNPTDIMIMTEALQNSKLKVTLHTVPDGVEALAFLRRSGTYADMPRPDLIILDINMPRKNGHEVLAEIKVDPSLKMIPVVMLTTSQADEDIARAYSNQVNCYVRKPMDFNRFIEVVKNIEDFWLTVVTLPKK